LTNQDDRNHTTKAAVNLTRAITSDGDCTIEFRCPPDKAGEFLRVEWIRQNIHGDEHQIPLSIFLIWGNFECSFCSKRMFNFFRQHQGGQHPHSASTVMQQRCPSKHIVVLS